MKKLERKETEFEGLHYGIKENGQKYLIREDRSRYFFPEEWNKFYNALKPQTKPIYDGLLQTGSRINELRHLKPIDIDFDRATVTLKVTKRKHNVGSNKTELAGKKRTFIISPQYLKRLRRYIQDNNIQEQDYIFHAQHNHLKPISKETVFMTMKSALKRAGIEDYYNFSLHNIRKTTGNWLKALGVPADEICLRLGHDHNTYLKHYASASIFDRQDKVQMIRILGNMYGF